MTHDFITLVSGLPRSGTSMMMKMLEAGGMPVLADHIRRADEDNPEGYYEFERVKKIETDQAWLPEARGKVVKMISALLKHLPATYRYKIVFMRRKLEEVLASQRQMLIRRGKPTDTTSDEKMAAYFTHHLERVERWLADQPNMDVLYVSYNELMQDPETHCAAVARFLDLPLDARRMAQVASGRLYRQRR
ncbi:MAG TPA: sulfotransferase [Candidatus Limnocylindria bacterium]|nr:sulfotransferase [Candidatus Limnocylindria bacterium]